MTTKPSPTVRRRRLSRLLGELRETSGMTRDTVAKKLDWTPSKITRIETGQWIRPARRDVRDLLDIYGVIEEEQREAYELLVTQARDKGWWVGYGDIVTSDYVGLEAEAASVRNYQPLMVPGLLQTEAYARAVVGAAMITAEDEVRRRVEVRMRRQERLAAEDPMKLWAVVDEAVLRRPVGGHGVMLDQLLHLRDAAKLPNVSIQVVPWDSGAYLGMGNRMALLSFPDVNDADVVYLENVAGELYLEKPDEIARYSMVFDHLRAAADSLDSSIARIEAAAKEMRESWTSDM